MFILSELSENLKNWPNTVPVFFPLRVASSSAQLLVPKFCSKTPAELRNGGSGIRSAGAPKVSKSHPKTLKLDRTTRKGLKE